LNRRHLFFLFSLSVILTSCTSTLQTTRNAKHPSVDLDSIIARGRITAVIDFNSINYFVYKGEPMGFSLELLKEFARHLGVDLEIITEKHSKHAVDILNEGKADLLAMDLSVPASRKWEILFSSPVMETRQVLVRREPGGRHLTRAGDFEEQPRRHRGDLVETIIYVEEGTLFQGGTKSLPREIGDSIYTVEVPFDSEELIRNVASGDIDFTVCDENLAIVNSARYPAIDISTSVNLTRDIAWGVRKRGSEKLLPELNRWIETYRHTRAYSLLHAKYFRNTRSGEILNNDYCSLSTGRISAWDDMIKRASAEIDWDWRLLASLIYQESRFRSDVVSWAGARGLMQVMPATGRNFGIDITASPADNVKAGIMYIKWLQSFFETRVADEDERIKFILAAYNAGPGHIVDAMRLAGKHGLDPARWDDNTEAMLLKKSLPLYFNDAVVKNGYFRGTESVNFVDDILERFNHYRNIIDNVQEEQLTLNSI
jgi:membrane-bound lytic murein transglycosylase F